MKSEDILRMMLTEDVLQHLMPRIMVHGQIMMVIAAGGCGHVVAATLMLPVSLVLAASAHLVVMSTRFAPLMA